MDKIKTIKIKKEDGSISEESYIISVDAKNVDMNNGKDLQETIGDIDIDNNGNISQQLSNINKKVYYFNTVDDMKNANLKVNDCIITLGYYAFDDDGGAEYKIVNGTHTDNGGSYIKLNNNLYAKLIITKNINIKNFGAKGDGTSDNTIKIQNAIDYINSIGGGNLLITNGTYMINAVTGIQLKSNVNLLFSNAKLKALPTASNSYNVIHIEDTENNYIENAVIEGERAEHLGSTGESGHGIYIRGDAKNIVFNNLTISNCWGDGILLYRTGKSSGSNYVDYIPNGIYLNGTTHIYNCRRQGISILAAENLIIERLLCEDINGTLPMSGIDIESEHSVDLLGNIYIGYLKTVRCSKCFTMRSRSKITGNIHIGTLEHVDPLTEVWGGKNSYVSPFRIIFEYFDTDMAPYTISVDNVYTDHGTAQLENIYKGCTPKVVIGNLYSKERTFIRSADSTSTKGLININYNKDTDLSNIVGNITINNLIFDYIKEYDDIADTNVRPYSIAYSGSKQTSDLEVQDITINNIIYKQKHSAINFIEPRSSITFGNNDINYFRNGMIMKRIKDGGSETITSLADKINLYVLPNQDATSTTNVILRMSRAFSSANITIKKSAKVIIDLAYNTTTYGKVYLNEVEVSESETTGQYILGTFNELNCIVENKNKNLYITTF